MNRYQKAAHKMGERRVRGDEIDHYVELSRSEDPDDRLEAASHLCPCHVRRRIDTVWSALYRMLEDEDVRVRRAAWHTLEDGGRPDDPKLDEIIDRVAKVEDDRQVLGFIREISGPREKQIRVAEKLQVRPVYTLRGRCDFCAKTGVAVRKDFDTEIPDGNDTRAAAICEACDAAS